MSRNAAEWMQQPKFPRSHFVDSRIYTDEAIFREEQQKVFNKSWIIGRHESELPGAFDYRTFHASGRHAAHHRARRGPMWCAASTTSARIAATRCSTIRSAMPNASPASFTRGRSTPRATASTSPARSRDSRSDSARPTPGCARCAPRSGLAASSGSTSTTARCTLKEYIGDALGMLEEYMSMPLEVFHYHKAIVNTNYKLWHDTNSEFYHDYHALLQSRHRHAAAAATSSANTRAIPNGHASGGLDDDQVRRL